MKSFDMFYKLACEETVNGKRHKYTKYGCTQNHAEDRARQVEASARKTGHDMRVNAKEYYYNPERSDVIGQVEHAIHHNPRYHHYDDGGSPFNGSTEIYEPRDGRRIEKELRRNGIKLKKCKN